MDYTLKAKEILSSCLFIPVDKIPDNATINDVKPLDSLAFELIVLEIEAFLQKEVDPMDLLELSSVQDLADILEKEHK